LARSQARQIAVQVGGRLRGTIAIDADASEEAIVATAAAEPNVARALTGQSVVKRVYIPGRVVNFVLARP
jgi:leucyl-tRNA synthetase